jgi:hypothetical protein
MHELSQHRKQVLLKADFALLCKHLHDFAHFKD